jgi:uncharacterized protein (DUF1501 family)
MIPADHSTRRAFDALHTAERDVFAMDRRRFLTLVGAGLGAGLVAGPGSSLLDFAIPGTDPSTWAAGPITDGDGILVVVTMMGGNDGLNTIVPIGDGRYYDQRGSTAISAANTLPLDGQSGFHPALTELHRWWNAGHLGVVEGVGFANGDLSHFSSMAKWMAGNPNGSTTGWVGRWLDGHLGSDKDLFAAAEIGNAVPLQLIGDKHRGTAIPAGYPAFGSSAEDHHQRLFDGLRYLNTAPIDSWRGRVGQATVDQLDIAPILASSVPTELVGSTIEKKLEVAARLINANLGMRVITVSFGDFDVHARQPDRHPVLLAQLNAGIKRFFESLHPGWRPSVAMMTMSEFGRTSFGNDGAGTDHGSSAPHFVIGDRVLGGRYGQRPSLAGLGRWDRMGTHVDTRDYFGSIVDGWLGGGGAEVLGRPIQNLGLFTAGPGGVGLPVPTLGLFSAISPVRIHDTRQGGGSLGPGSTLTVPVQGRGGVPSTGVTAIALNVTATQTSERTNLRVFPSGGSVPNASSLNPINGRAVPSMVIVGVGANGAIDIYNELGTTACIVDVLGYFGPSSGATLVPLQPDRLLDTREGVGVSKGPASGGQRIDLQITGRGGVPVDGVDSVVLNVAALQPTSSGYLTVWPTGESLPNVSNLNYTPGMNLANLVVCKLGADGRVSLEASAGSVNVIADVVGCFASGGTRQAGLVPTRLLDTRTGVGADKMPLGEDQVMKLQVAGQGGVPPTAKAVILNITAVRATKATFVTVWPDGAPMPTASTLNVAQGQTISNLVVAKLGNGGRVKLYNRFGAAEMLADVTGYFT